MIRAINNRLELGRLIRFVCVGGVATATHAACLWGLVELGEMRPSTATVFAFLVAFAVSYLGHYFVTFQSTQDHRRALPGYALAASSGALLNWGLFFVVTEVFSISYWIAFLISILTVPIVVFSMSRRLAFTPTQNAGLAAVPMAAWVIPIACYVTVSIFALAFHYRMPFWDHFDLIPFYDQMITERLALADLFRQHGAHWHASGYVIMPATASLTDMAHWSDIVVSLILAGLGFVALANILHRTASEFGAQTRLVWIFAFAAVFHFSLDQSANWLWGWQVALFASMTEALWTIDLLSRPALGPSKMILAILCSLIAIYGFATGWVLIPIGFGLILICPETSGRMRAGAALAWGVMALLLGVHFVQTSSDYAAQMVAPDLSLTTAWGILHYCLNFIGNGLIGAIKPLALLAAILAITIAIGLIVFLAGRERQKWRAARGLIALAMLSVGGAVLTALGRWSEFGPDQAFASRYVTIATPVWIAFAVLVLICLQRLPERVRQLSIFGLCLLIAAKAVNLATPVHSVELAVQINQCACEIVLDWPNPRPDSLSVIAPVTPSLENRLAILHEQEVSLFHPDAMKRCVTD